MHGGGIDTEDLAMDVPQYLIRKQSFVKVLRGPPEGD